MRVGFIGLGKMGKPMALNLLNGGFELTVHNRSRGVVEELASLGAKAATSPAEVCRASEFVLTCLPTPQSVETVYLGPDGIIPAVASGQVLVDLSTVAPSTSLKLRESAVQRGAGFLDAPVSGGVPRAQSGTLTIMVGGDEATLNVARPVLEVLGEKVILVGGPGAGSVVKLTNQLLVGIHSVAAAEALVFGVKAGADPQALLEVIGSSFGASAMFNRTVPMALKRQFGSATDVGILSKDMSLITSLGRELSVRLLLGSLAEQVLTEAKGLGLANNDIASLVKPLEEIAGIQVDARLNKQT